MMAFIPYFALGPTSILGLIGVLHSKDPVVPTPSEDWTKATVDLLIPAYQEEATVVLCLSSIQKQTLKPRHIFLIDDASTDNTVTYAQAYAKKIGMNLQIIRRKKNAGKTPSMYYAAHTSNADVLAIVDVDTILRSNNYLERLVQELFQGVGISCACGFVLPLTDNDRQVEYTLSHLNIEKFTMQYPEAPFSPDNTWFQRLQRNLSSAYREELYLFLQRVIYQGEMRLFGTLIFPIGCAVVYRRENLKAILEQYAATYGFDLTTSEDIFLGFAFAEKGYKNIVVPDVYALTMEPRYLRIYHQIFKWSSSFLQSCYYFNAIFLTPFKWPAFLMKKRRDRHNVELQKIIEKRKIKEAYRQPFGEKYTQQYGRNIGWFIFSTAVEKITYPTILLILIILQYWSTLLITFCIEVSVYTVLITYMHKNRRIRNFFKAILLTPIRYSQLMFDLIVITRFMIDLWVTKNRRWRK